VTDHLEPGARAAENKLAAALDYLLLANSLAWTVYISAPLLLAWIAAADIWLTRSSQAGSAGPPT
jgi:hypothetical protein